MKLQLPADRKYKLDEAIRWRGRKIGRVSQCKDGVVAVEVFRGVMLEMEEVGARFILDRGNVVEIYKRE